VRIAMRMYEIGFAAVPSNRMSLSALLSELNIAQTEPRFDRSENAPVDEPQRLPIRSNGCSSK
jgi:hypothetical protein